MNDADADGIGILRTAQTDSLAVNGDRALVRPVNTREDLEQGGLARTVFAEQSDYLIRADNEGEIVDRDERSETLGDASQFEDRADARPQTCDRTRFGQWRRSFHDPQMVP